MKIAYLAEINTKDNTAPEIHVNEVAGNLKKMGNQVYLIIPKTGIFKNNKFNLDIVYLSFKFLPLSMNHLFFEFLLIFYLPFLILIKKLDVIYVRQGAITLIPSVYSKIFNIPYFTEVNGNLQEEMADSKKPLFYMKICYFVETISYNIASKIIVVTSQLKDYIAKKYEISLNKIVVVENGVDSETLNPLEKKLCKSKLGLSNNTKYLCYIGNFAPWQGLEILIKSFKIVLKKYSNIILLLVGAGEQKENLIKLSKKYNISERIIFTGKVEHELIPRYICASEICLAPFTAARNKRMGSSAFKTYEYASCGRPIITTHPNFIEKHECGLLAKADSPQDLAKKIIYLLNNPKLAKQMGKNGRRAVIKEYSWKNVAKKTEIILKNALKNQSKKRDTLNN